MTMYFLQTGLLLLACYCVGCVLGCMLRQLFTPAVAHPTVLKPQPALQPQPAVLTSPTIVPRQAAPAPQAPVVKADVPREVFRRTDAPLSQPAPSTHAPPPVPRTEAPRPVAPAPAPAAAPAGALAAAAAAAAISAARARETVSAAPAPAPSKPVAPPAAPRPAAPASAPARVTLPAASSPSVSSGVAVGGGVAAASGTDDLKRIRGIGPDLEASLQRMGIRRYTDVAAWTAGDVDKISKSLGFKGRIEHENWIEQAQVLAKGGETAFSRRYDRGDMETVPAPKPQPPIAAPKTVAVPVASVPPPATRAESAPPASIGAAAAAAAAAAVAAAAAAAASRSPAQPPKPAPASAPAATAAPAPGPATPPAAPAKTAAAAALAAAERVRSAAAATAAAPPTSPPGADRVRELAGILSGTRPAGPAPAQAPAPAPRPAASAPAGDDLTRIRGIDAELHKLLNVRGITRFSQIGGWTPVDAERFGSALALRAGRIETDRWIEQARALAGMPPLPEAEARESASWHQRRPAETWQPGQPPAPGAKPAVTAPTSAPPPVATPSAAAAAAARAAASVAAAKSEAAKADAAKTSDMARLPSVRSEAFKGGPAAGAASSAAAAAAAATAAAQAAKSAAPGATAGAGARVVRSGVPDDLKRIKRVGIALEKKLHGLGVIHYEQIAGWTQTDIDKMSEILDFKGVIERENWVEQARILASGGLTDFARRVDRGEFDAAKPKPVK
jgi:predicted flap endonuclease-1-like 5' DNA nuclease